MKQPFFGRIIQTQIDLRRCGYASVLASDHDGPREREEKQTKAEKEAERKTLKHLDPDEGLKDQFTQMKSHEGEKGGGRK